MASLLSSQVSSSTSQRSFRKRAELFQGCPALSLLICNFSLLYMLKNKLAWHTEWLVIVRKCLHFITNLSYMQ